MIENLIPAEMSELGVAAEAFHELPPVGRIYCGPDFKDGINFLNKEIFQDEAYCRHGIEYRENFTVFDVGAHIGLFALYAAAKCNGKLSLFCFEPIPDTYYFL